MREEGPGQKSPSADEDLKSVGGAAPDATRNTPLADEGLKSVAIAEPDSNADVGNNEIGGEGKTTVGTDTEGRTSTGVNAIAGGTVVDSGQTTTHIPTTPPLPPDDEDEQERRRGH